MKIDRAITIFVISTPVLFIVLYLTSLLIYKSQWKYTYSELQMQEWVNEINKTPELENNFYFVFDTLKIDGSESTLNFEYLKLVKFHFTGIIHFHRGGGKNYYLEAAKILLKKYQKDVNTLLNPILTLAFGLEEKVELRKCVAYYLYNKNLNILTDSLTCNELTGIEEFSNLFFDKKLLELNNDEIITTISAFDMASFKDTITQDLIGKRKRVNEHYLKRKREKLKK